MSVFGNSGFGQTGIGQGSPSKAGEAHLDYRIASDGNSLIEQAKTVTSTLRWTAGNGPAVWASVAAGGKFEFPLNLNLSVSGLKSDEILTHVSAINALAGDALLVTFHTNDNRSPNDYATATSQDNIQSYLDQCDKDLIVVLLAPPGGSAAHPAEILSPSQLANRIATNEWLKTKASSRIKIIDAYAMAVDPGETDGRAKPGYLRDGIHLTQLYAYEIGEAIADAIGGRFKSRSLYDPAGAINSNPAMTGSVAVNTTSGGATIAGTIATGFSVTAVSGTGLAIEVEAATEHGQRVRITGTPSAASQIFLQSVIAAASIAEGDVIAAVGRIITEDGGVSGIVELSAGARIRNASNATIIETKAGGTSAGFGETPDVDLDGPFLSDRATVPAGPYHATNSIVYARVTCQTGVAVDAEFWVPFLKVSKVA